MSEAWSWSDVKRYRPPPQNGANHEIVDLETADDETEQDSANFRESVRGRKLNNNDVDKHVARRIRERRLMAGVTQAELADAVGVSYQQLHKYETGKNRVTAATLYTIAHVLNVSVGSFFYDYNGTLEAKQLPQDRALLELNKIYKGIKKRRHREAVSELARTLLQSQDDDE